MVVLGHFSRVICDYKGQVNNKVAGSNPRLIAPAASSSWSVLILTGATKTSPAPLLLAVAGRLAHSDRSNGNVSGSAFEFFFNLTLPALGAKI